MRFREVFSITILVRVIISSVASIVSLFLQYFAKSKSLYACLLFHKQYIFYDTNNTNRAMRWCIIDTWREAPSRGLSWEVRGSSGGAAGGDRTTGGAAPGYCSPALDGGVSTQAGRPRGAADKQEGVSLLFIPSCNLFVCILNVLFILFVSSFGVSCCLTSPLPICYSYGGVR